MSDPAPTRGDPTRDFYEGLADDYRLLYPDWAASVERQATVLETLLSGMGVAPGASVLDCTAGIGTQALGLAGRGYLVTAADLSPAPLERLRREAAARNLSIPTHAADLRALDTAIPQAHFDAVIAMDNALPHLPTEADLTRAMAQMRARLRPGGAWMASVRDYDQLRKERPRFADQRVMDGPGGRRVTFQVWDWADDGSGYALEQFVVQETGARWETHCHRGRYRAVGREELERSLAAAGLVQIAWRPAESTGFYQPVLTARAP